MEQHYLVKGVVETGQGNGSKIGAPTANLPLAVAEEQQMVPGLYTCSAVVDGAPYRGLLYYGINSLTERDCLEVFLFEYSGVLYGELLSVTTTGFIRPPRRFSSPEELQAQIAQDIQMAAEKNC